ncbi:hypothetical protein [Bifidobacterium miconisargentati]|uniref:hypothetical protein n=1 Tax=Bifidobacterium miconisargentati TaxID=2834437 RepID=UPI001BDBD979|nr:hypothetical protein [Bifidobacterium miconisargentati]MBW3090448.1 hypothetical protein [Bifidobacterium miconisargentati]
MTIIQAISTLISVLVIPWVVQLIKTQAMTGTTARWVSLAISLAAGAATGLLGGIPNTPGDWVTCILAVVGGTQIAYSAFKAVGITNNWLDALLNVGNVNTPKHAA